MSHLFQDTKNCKAHYYLDETSYTITKEEFVKSMREDGLVGAMLYIDGGYVPLTIAVLCWGTPSNPNTGGAVSAFEHWARNNDRLDEIGEDDPDWEYFGEYELHIEIIPAQ